VIGLWSLSVTLKSGALSPEAITRRFVGLTEELQSIWAGTSMGKR
jgi:hypothetical protein